MSRYQKGIEAAAQSLVDLLKAGDLHPTTTAHWERRIVGPIEAFLAAQPEVQWCTTHSTVFHGPDLLRGEPARWDCRIVPAHIVVNDTAPPAEGGEE